MATILQDNFEHNNTDIYISKSETNGTVTISSTQAHSGSYSLKFDITVNNGNADIRHSYMGIGGLDDFRIRFWVYYGTDFTDDLAVANDNKWKWWIGNNANYAQAVAIEAIRSEGSSYVAVQYNSYAVYVGVALPSASAWHCIEARIVKSTTVGALYLWVDGVLAGSSTSQNTGADNIVDCYLGCSSTVGMTAISYIDDIVMDTSRYIGTGYRVSQDGAVGSPFQY